MASTFALPKKGVALDAESSLKDWKQQHSLA
jgi:hypothetical protein